MNSSTGEVTPRLRVLLLLAAVSPCTLAAEWSTQPLGLTDSPQFIVLVDETEVSQSTRALLNEEPVDALLDGYGCWQLETRGDVGERAVRALGVDQLPTLLIRDARGTEVWRWEGAPNQEAVMTALVIHGPRPGGSLPAAAMTEPDEAVPPIIEDGRGETADAGLDLIGASSVADATELRLTVEVAGSANATGFHLFLDTDDDASTGFANEIIAGADMMVEGLTAYRHAGGSPTEWLWDNVGTINAVARGSQLSIRVPHELFGLVSGQRVRMAFHTSDANWAPADWMPDSGMVGFDLP